MIINTTGIGSLPYKDIKEAVDFSFKFDIPFLPQLPNLGSQELMINQTKDIGNIACWELFLKELDKRKTKKCKLQVAGPITLKSTEGILRNVNIMVKEVFKRCEKMILFIDEPYYCGEKEKAIIINQMISEFHFPFLEIGVHSCNRIDFKNIDVLQVDYFSFDMQFGQKEFDIKQKLCFGISKEFTIDEKNHLTNSRDILLTPPCGLANYQHLEAQEMICFLNDEKTRLLRYDTRRT